MLSTSVVQEPRARRGQAILAVLKKLLCCWLVLLPWCAVAENVRLRQFTVDDGLSQSEVTHIAQDANGYLWIGTAQGLNRYDGYRFNPIHGHDKLLANYATSLLFVDSKNNLWVSSGWAFNFRLRPGSKDFEAIRMPDISQQTLPKDLFEAQGFVDAVEGENGDIWFATSSEFYHYRAKTQSLHYYFSMHQQLHQGRHTVRDMLIYRDHLLIAASNGFYALTLFDETPKLIRLPHTPQPLNELSANTKFLKMNGNHLLIGTVEGLYRYPLAQLDKDLVNPPQTATNAAVKVAIPSLNIWRMFDHHKGFLIGTNDGVYQWSGETILSQQLSSNSASLRRLFRYSDTRFYTSDDDIRSMFRDKQGNYWLGSRQDGLFKWTPNKLMVRSFDKNNGLSADDVWKLARGDGDDLWVGTGNGVNRIHLRSGEIEQYHVNPDEKAVYSGSAIVDLAWHQNQLWAYTLKGIRVLDASSGKLVKPQYRAEDEKLFNSAGNDLWFINDDEMLILTGRNLYLHNIKTLETREIEGGRSENDIQHSLVQVMGKKPGETNKLLIAGMDKMLELDLSNFRLNTLHQLPASEQVRTSPQSALKIGNEIWISYPSQGVAIVDANTYQQKRMLTAKDLNTNSGMDLYMDKQRRVWMTSNEGILQIDPVTFKSRLFDVHDGLNASEMNGGAFLPLANGHLMLGSVKGVMEIAPSAMKPEALTMPPVQIASVKLLSRPLPDRLTSFNNQTITLNHEDFGLDIEFSAMDFVRPKQVLYRYWMEGANATEPVEIKKSELLLPKLAVGKTSFYVSAFRFDQGGFSQPAKLDIVVKPAPWNSTAARLGYLAAILSIFGFIFYQRYQRLQAQKLAHERVKKSESRLRLALKGSGSNLWEWRADTDTIFEPRLPGSPGREQEGVDFEQHINAIHPTDRPLYRFFWHQFISGTGQTFNHSYRLKNKDGVYCWYTDLGTVTHRDEQGKPSKVSGTYTDITESKADKDKIELFFNAFENTRDMVFIVDLHKHLIAANRAFYRTTEYQSSAIKEKAISFLMDNNNEQSILPTIYENLEKGSSWEGEAILRCRFRAPIPVKLSASAFMQSDERTRYVFAMTDISSQKEAEARLRKLANYDNLTGLPNRALLLDRLEHAILSAARQGESLALMFIDLDRFKQVNDTLGHDIGDLLLVSVGKVLSHVVRSNDTVSRMGGDEFVVLLVGIDSIDVVNRIAQRFIEQINAINLINNHKINVSPSIGIALFPDNGETASELLKNADNAMYFAKSAGRNNFKYYQKSMNDAAVNRMNLERQLREAVKEERFFLAYQPQFEALSGQLVGFEGLARWRNEAGEIISPARFITLAEELGLILDITEQLIRSGIRQLSQWHQQGFNVGLAINLSARHLHHYDLPAFMRDLSGEFRFKPELFEFELTESVMMQETESAQKIFDELAEMQIELALDDFGTGYSSLKYLNELPISKVKIDRSFISQIGNNRGNEVIIETVVALSQALNLKTVAEGVETIEQKNFLANLGVNYLQGYLLAKPMSADEANRLLKTQSIG